ncbi:MAG: hypothetical protein MUE41_10450 [Gemmatimonadaceae bacterium]|nr:hypothetical protein [Gemmatimonadaceae bacterium]
MAAAPIAAHAQQAIINLPSADITPQGRHFLMHESALKYRSPNDDWATTHFYTYGLGRRTEFTTTVYNLERPAMRNLSVGMGLKTAQPVLGQFGAKRELLLTAGHILPVSLQGAGVGHYTYGHLSGRLPKLNTRITAGGGYGTRQVFDRNVAVGLFGVEHQLTSHLQFVTEWITGDHAKGFVIPGLLYHRSDWILVAGYKFPNTQRTIGRGLIFEVGRFFGGRRGAHGGSHGGAHGTPHVGPHALPRPAAQQSHQAGVTTHAAPADSTTPSAGGKAGTPVSPSAPPIVPARPPQAHP